MSIRSPVGFLSTCNNPLLPFLLDQVAQLPDVEPVLIFDERGLSAKEIRMIEERTYGAFPNRDPELYLTRYRWTVVPDHNGEACQAYVKAQGISLLVNAGTPRRVAEALLHTVPQGILNVHPGLLPRYRGATCCEWAIYHDDPVGVTAHFMDTDLDHGPILFWRPLLIKKGQTYTEVRVALYRLAHQVYREAIHQILHERLTPASTVLQPTNGTLPPFKPIPEALLGLVKRKLINGTYRYAE